MDDIGLLTTIYLLLIVQMIKADKKDRVEHVWKSRNKAQLACHSCVTYPRTQSSSKSFNNQSTIIERQLALIDRLETAGLRIPEQTKYCAETLSIVQPKFFGVNLVFCENSQNNPGACVKIKGQFMGDTFVLRECWHRLWHQPRSYNNELSEHCYNDAQVQTFVQTVDNIICFCEDDLCNRQTITTNTQFSLILLLQIIYYLIKLCS